MSDSAPQTAPQTPLSLLAQRKKMLIAQGESYRLGINESMAGVRNNLEADALAKNAINHISATASAAFDNIFRLKNFNLGNLQVILPLLTSGFSLVSRRGLVKPLLRGTVVLVAVSAVGYFLFKKKWPRRAEQERNAAG